jgi:1,4-alpha-glucan branching enzyme
VYRRGPLVFVFNFHPTESYFGLRIPVPDFEDYKVILNTDDTRFAGVGRSQSDALYPIQQHGMYGRGQSIQMYLPNRSAQVLCPVSRLR